MSIKLTPEQFDALIAIIDPPPSMDRAEAIDAARALLVEQQVKFCAHGMLPGNCPMEKCEHSRNVLTLGAFDPAKHSATCNALKGVMFVCNCQRKES